MRGRVCTRVCVRVSLITQWHRASRQQQQKQIIPKRELTRAADRTRPRASSAPCALRLTDKVVR